MEITALRDLILEFAYYIAGAIFFLSAYYVYHSDRDDSLLESLGAYFYFWFLPTSASSGDSSSGYGSSDCNQASDYA